MNRRSNFFNLRLFAEDNDLRISFYKKAAAKFGHLKLHWPNLNLKQYTAKNLYEAVKNCLHCKQISFRNISAAVTDFPSVLIKFQKLLTNDNPHIVRTHCVLHLFNLIEKHFASHPAMTWQQNVS
ncbi:hypothetical protein O181_061423 [Austropuccinia psidii MF-1]|uniref:DUF659 domain-containing protein n=1 Tax=Austropuccinia psidii MF-1 TaxID=1389203 RepID=A0A9Q3HYI5_9BASI|nr:hypothetical protein [Austropuccinia psidii MF-1]